ncbi:MAG: DUF839 domain-containing protein [Bacteroidetes bacterium]|nr:MAG: DUF839 domain-containing protein [Bacteroidota bacterium]
MNRLFFLLLWGSLLAARPGLSQHISDFTSLAPGSQTTDFRLATTHTFQYLIETGDPLTAGGNLPDRCDFSGYVPIAGSSTNGYLSVNSESNTGNVTILDINFLPATQEWDITASELVDFSPVGGTSRNCSGGITPWGTVVTCEEVVSPDNNGDGYYDFGWAVEIDPATRSVIDHPGGLVGGDKLWQMGNFRHENAVIHSNQRTVYQGDDSNPGYLYRFVANTAGDLSSGSLFVLKLVSPTEGQWVPLNNSTPNECNTTVSQAAAAGATAFNGIEDVEISPINGMVYFAVKGEGKTYRFHDISPLPGDSITGFETFVGGMSYTIDYGTGTALVPWDNWNDNLAFDDLGNLWVFQDGADNYIWVVGAGHTQAAPDVRIFGQAPLGSEPTGITFTPDHKYMFMSIMHPAATNSSSTVEDAFAVPRAFDEDVVLVVARGEFLGTLWQPLPLRWVDTWARPDGGRVSLGWTVSGRSPGADFVVEREAPDATWTEVTRVKARSEAGTATYEAQDPMPQAGRNRYRIRQVDARGYTQTSPVVEATVIGPDLRVYPNPAWDLLWVEAPAGGDEPLRVELIDAAGKVQVSRHVQSQQAVPVGDLSPGVYLLRIEGAGTRYAGKWMIR